MNNRLFSGIVSLVGLTGLALLTSSCKSGPTPRQSDGDLYWQQQSNPTMFSNGMDEGWTQQRVIMQDRIRRLTDKERKASQTYDYAREAALTDGNIDSNEASYLLPLLKELILSEQEMRNYAIGIQPVLIPSQQLDFYNLKIRTPEMKIDSYSDEYKSLVRITK